MKNGFFPGIFIAMEGLDGAGQTTQASMLEERLKQYGWDLVVKTKEPTKDNMFGRAANEVLDHKKIMLPLRLQRLFAMDRAWHLKNQILPVLKKGGAVICDRYAMSSLAYGSLDIPLEELEELNQEFLLPDFTFFLDVPAEICLDRIAKRGIEVKFFEKMEKLKKVYVNYKSLVEKDERTYVVDGTKSISDVAKLITKPLKKYNLL